MVLRIDHRVAVVVLVCAAFLAAACGTPEPSRPLQSAAPAVSAAASLAAANSPAPVATPATSPSPTPVPTPTPVPLATIDGKARVVSGDSIRVEGRIGVDGIPLAAAPVRVTALPLDGRPQTVQLTGTVPAGAKTAHIGVRVNIEGAGPHKANLTIYGASYTQDGSTKNRVRNPRLLTSTNHWGLHEDGITVRRSDIGPGLMIRIVDKPTQTTTVQTGGVAVTPGKRYRATMLIKVPQASIGSAYFTVVWLGDREIAREILDLVPAPLRLPERTSAADGGFSWTFRDLAPGRYRINVTYAGDATHQPATWQQVIRIR